MIHINIYGFLFLVVIGGLIFFLPRTLLAIPLLLTTCYMTSGQVLVLVGFDFHMLRIVILICWIRVVIRRETASIKLNAIDKTIILWVVVSIAAYTLLYQSSAAFSNQLGFAYNVLGIYFLWRIIIRGFEDTERALKIFCLLIVPLAGEMLMEYATGRNFFSIFGGMDVMVEVRKGRFRCQGPFAHSILAGTFGATLVPLFVGLWFQGENKKLISLIGLCAATIITVTSASSGPVLTYLFGIIGLCIYPFRSRMPIIRWGLLFGLIVLHIIMKAPVWYLIARISGLMGGSGWYRSHLINQTIVYFNQWWFIGTKDTRYWMPTYFHEYNRADITSQFVSESVNGGLGKLILFISIIYLSFRNLGLAIKKAGDNCFTLKILLWSMGSALFAHCVSFISVAYFDQIIVSWYMLLAMISITNIEPQEK